MIEVERYELQAGPAYHFASGRREFLQRLGFGLSLVLLLDVEANAQESGRGRRNGGNAMPQDIAAWLHVDPNGAIRVFTGKTEVGQNIRTSLTQAVSEELRVQPASIEIVMADTDLTPYDMGTFGSRTTPTMAPQLRKVAAAAREALIDLATDKWNTPRVGLTADNGCVKNPTTGASLPYGELTQGRQLVKTVTAASTTAPSGHSLEKVHARDIVSGSHRYASDTKRPGMLYGRVLRPPSYGSKLRQVTGPNVIRDGEFAGVVASNEFAATKALAALQAEWDEKPQPSSSELFSYLRSNTQSPVPAPLTLDGDHQIESTYTISYIAHVPLEPRAAVAEWTDGKVTVWTGSQVPFGVKAELAEAFGIPENRVRVIVPDTGSGYGGKHSGECAIEAARLAKAAGKPVKLIWTREEEFAWAYFRPAGIIDVRAGVAKDGTIAAWQFHNYNSGGSGIESPYDAAKKSIHFIPTKSPLRQGSYRGLAATANHFARESAIDDLAHAVNLDPLEFRLRNLSNPRMKAVLNAAAERFGWGKSRAIGISCGFEKGGYVACCAQVSVPSLDKVKIERVAIAFECGAIVNPAHLENQVEGSVVQALGGALFEHIDFANGRLTNGRLSRYRVPRFSDLPEISVVLVDRKDLPSAGAGETPIVGLAPAVGNAIFQATGHRLRSLPMCPGQVKIQS